MASDKYLDLLVFNIKERLELIRENQAWLAKKTGLTPASISRLLNKETKEPALDTIVFIAEAFGCGPGDLLTIKNSNELSDEEINNEKAKLVLEMISALPAIDYSQIVHLHALATGYASSTARTMSTKKQSS